MVHQVLRAQSPTLGEERTPVVFVTTKFFSFSNSGVLTPVDPPSRTGSAVIATDQVEEVDKAESIPVKHVVCVLAVALYEELI